MGLLGWVFYGLLCVIVLILAFLLLGTLRTVGLLRWRLDQLEATTPSHVGRRGLRIGTKAPDFTLPDLHGSRLSLHDFDGKRVLLVFMQPGCTPCNAIVPALNRLQLDGGYDLIGVAQSELEAGLRWVEKVGAKFPILLQENESISRRYEAIAVKRFAFLLDEQMVITSKGVITDNRSLGFVLSNARRNSKTQLTETVTAEN